MESFEQEKSSSNKYYYRNRRTGKTQWGDRTFFNTNIYLPYGWIRLNIDGRKHVYRYFGKNNYDSSFYAPEMKDLVEMTYKQLEDLESDKDFDVVQDVQKEMCRRNKLFRSIAQYLKIDCDGIIDESLEYIAKTSLDDVIRLIEQEEEKNLGKYATLTAFQRIRRDQNLTFFSETSIRELCGLNTRDVEASNALHASENCICPITAFLCKNPVVCNNSQTMDKKSAEKIFRLAQRTGRPALCPITRDVITSFVPNIFAKQTIVAFVEKYENQKGGDWKAIIDLCRDYRTKDTEEDDTEEDDTEEDDIEHLHEPIFETPEELAERLELERFQRELADEIWAEEEVRREHLRDDDESSSSSEGGGGFYASASGSGGWFLPEA